MSDAPVSELEGRELDAAVAVEVMDWKEVESKEEGYGLRRGEPNLAGDPPGPVEDRDLPSYSSDMSHAWKVLEAVNDQHLPAGDSLALIPTIDADGGDWAAGLVGEYKVFGVALDRCTAQHDDPSVAICRAALRTVREES